MIAGVMMLALAMGVAQASTIPLESSRYDVRVVGGVAEIELEQVFSNTASEFIEAVYTFPLDGGAAVDDMVIEIGQREIVGVIKERDQARKDYEKARAKGQAAGLTEQQRPNAFTQSIANIPPGEAIRVRLHVVQPLRRVDRSYELAIPLVVGPRFTPKAVQTDQSIVDPPVAKADPGVIVAIDVDINAGMDIASVDSPTHGQDMVVHHGRSRVSLDGIQPNSDFVLRWAVNPSEPTATAMEQDAHMLLRFEAPDAAPSSEIVPRELIWIIDTSGSQQGLPMEMTKAAVHQGLASMNPGDRFELIQFADGMSRFGAGLIPASDAAIDRASEWVSGLRASGGTNMVDAVYGALTIPEDPTRERYVIMVTDGLIGNERDVLASIADHLGPARLFTFGLGNGTNRWLLEEMALEGGGLSTFVMLDERPEETVARFMAGIEKPVLTDIAIDWGEWVVDSVYPGTLGDLMAGQPLEVVARTTGGEGPIRVTGRRAGRPFEALVDVARLEGTALGSLWARARVADLEREQHWGERDDIKLAITDTALEYRLLTRYTSFVAIDRPIVNAGGRAKRVEQPLDLPEGMNYASTVSRTYTPPGDPLLTVNAPSDCRSVVAVYPWGDAVKMRWDAVRSRWYDRFLVPRDVQDGRIDVAVFIHHRDGSVSRSVVSMVVDSEADEFNAWLSVHDDATTLTLATEEPIRTIEAQPVGRPDLRKRLDVIVDRDQPFAMTFPGEWTEVDVVVTDRAMNTRVQRVHQ